MSRYDEDGKEYLGADDTRNFLFAVNSGYISGHEQNRRYGINSNISTVTDPEDIWDGGGNYVYDSSNSEMFVYSTEVTDVCEIKVTGLIDDNGKWIRRTVTVPVVGSTPVSAGLFIRIFEAKVVSSNPIVGDILVTITNTAGLTPSNDFLRAKITAGRNITLMSMYTVPSGYTAFLYKVFFSVAKLTDAEFSVDTRENGSLFSTIAIVGIFEESKQYELGYEKVPEKSDIKISARTETNNTIARSSFHFLLVRNSELRLANN